MLYSKGIFPNFFKGAPLVLETERGNLVSPSYQEGEIIHIYHNQNLTSAFPTCLVCFTSLYSKTLEISHCSYRSILAWKERFNLLKTRQKGSRIIIRGFPYFQKLKAEIFVTESVKLLGSSLHFACKRTWSKEVSILIYGLLY